MKSARNKILTKLKSFLNYLKRPMINHRYKLEKFPGKGGWTYAAIPEIMQDPKSPFGWVKVKGSIDQHPLKNYRLMPMGNGKLFLPVKAEIRKKIGKSVGDYVHVILYPDNDPIEIPEDLLLCFQDDPAAHENFLKLTEGKQKSIIQWIFAAKTEEVKAERIATTLSKLSKGHKWEPS